MTRTVVQCAICGAETELYVNGRPLCVDCTTAAQESRKASEPARTRERLQEAELVARAELDAALAAFGTLTAARGGKVPAEAIAHASEGLARIRAAQERLRAARRRLLEFESNGAIPEDLTSSQE